MSYPVDEDEPRGLDITERMAEQVEQILDSLDGFEDAPLKDQPGYLLRALGELARVMGEAVLRLELAASLHGSSD